MMNAIHYSFASLMVQDLLIVNFFTLKKDKRLKDCFHKNEDVAFDRLVSTLGQVAEQCLPSLTHTLLVWHEAQLTNLAFLKQTQAQSQADQLGPVANLKVTLKDKKLQFQAKL